MDTSTKLSVTEKKNLWLLLAGLGVSRIGTLAFSFAVGLYILNLTGSGLSFALSLVLSAVPRIILSPLAGIVADKFNRKVLTVFGDILSGLVVLALLVQSEISISSLYIVIASLAVVNTFFDLALGSAVPNLVKDKNLIKINSMSEATRSIASIAGPVVGGLLFGFGSLKLIILINGISFIISGISESFINFSYNTKLTEEERTSGKKDFGEVKNFFKVNKLFVIILMMSLSFNFFISLGISVPFTYMMNNVLGISPRFIGIIEAILPIGIILGSIIISNMKKFDIYKLIYLNCVIMGFAMALLGIPFIFISSLGEIGNVLYLGSVLFVVGFNLAFINVPLNTKMQVLIPEELRGRVSSVFAMIGGFLVPFALILSGGLIQIVTAQSIITFSGVMIMIAMVGFMSRKGMKELFSDIGNEVEVYTVDAV